MPSTRVRDKIGASFRFTFVQKAVVRFLTTAATWTRVLPPCSADLPITLNAKLAAVSIWLKPEWCAVSSWTGIIDDKVPDVFSRSRVSPPIRATTYSKHMVCSYPSASHRPGYRKKLQSSASRVGPFLPIIQTTLSIFVSPMLLCRRH